MAEWRGDEAFLAVYAMLPLLAGTAAVALRKYGRVPNLAWALQTAAIVTWFAAIGILDAALSWGAARPSDTASAAAATAIPVAVGLAVCGFALAWIWYGLGRVRAILIGPQLGLYLTLMTVAIATGGKTFLGILFFIGLFGLAAADMGRSGRRVAFQWLLAMIGARMLVFYFDAFGGLAMTGVGLIGAGLLILLATFLWHRNRNRVMSWLEREGA